MYLAKSGWPQPKSDPNGYLMVRFPHLSLQVGTGGGRWDEGILGRKRKMLRSSHGHTHKLVADINGVMKRNLVCANSGERIKKERGK